jgi:hypothetical protein
MRKTPRPTTHEFTVCSASFKPIATVYASTAREALRQAQDLFGAACMVGPEPKDEQYEAWKRLNGY